MKHPPHKSYRKIRCTQTLVQRARVLALSGDETRIRILCFLSEYHEACVSDIAESLETSINTVSHHLRMMRDNGLLASERTGTRICYKLVPNDFVEQVCHAICV